MKEIIKMIAVLSIICAISGLILSTLKNATRSRIEEQVLTYVQGPAIKSVLTDCDNNPIIDRKKLKMQDGNTVTVFPAIKDGKLVAVALESFAPGYSGDIGVMVGFALGDDSLTGIGVTTQTETPGLGTRVTEPIFTRRFTGHGLENLNLKSAGGDIDGISGATFSSVGTMNAVIKASNHYRNLKQQMLQSW